LAVLVQAPRQDIRLADEFGDKPRLRPIEYLRRGPHLN
jgi:hypothetical protein